MSAVKIKFGMPEHGWLPVNLEVRDYTLNINASDVPVDPLGLLIIALSKALLGVEGEVWWNLEPNGYYFSFGPKAEKYFLKIESVNVSREKETRSVEFEMSGKFEDTVLPFWRALREFESQRYSEPAWPEFPKPEMNKLTELIKKKKG